MLAILKIVIVTEMFQRKVGGWHDLTNVDYHCWPLSANGANPTPFTSCPGVNIRWVVPPPDEIRAQEPFNVTYELTLGPQFFPWAVSFNIFNEAGGTGISNATEAEDWCKNTICPLPKDATQENCCIHHVNVHSCPLDNTALVQNGLCGPWIPPHGSIFTHSEVHVGPVDHGNWTSGVGGLYEPGDVSMIAHFKLAKMHIAVEKQIKVLPRTVCGDGNCEGGEGETCHNCPADCGSCPLKVWQISIIIVGCLVALGVPIGACGQRLVVSSPPADGDANCVDIHINLDAVDGKVPFIGIGWQWVVRLVFGLADELANVLQIGFNQLMETRVELAGLQCPLFSWLLLWLRRLSRATWPVWGGTRGSGRLPLHHCRLPGRDLYGRRRFNWRHIRRSRRKGRWIGSVVGSDTDRCVKLVQILVLHRRDCVGWSRSHFLLRLLLRGGPADGVAAGGLAADSARRGIFASFISTRSTSNVGSGTGESLMGEAPRNQMFAATASYDGRVVVVRRVRKLYFLLTKKIREEVKTVRELDHSNLCRFIGGCIELPNICIISEYCPKGSINDVLLNDDVNLNWSFRFSFASDIARGLGYLHQHKIVHGRVRSNNCVVDDRWTVKITDYGLERFRLEDLDEEEQNQYDQKERRLRVYKGPEFWGMAEYYPTFQGDVYAFGVILVEIATRNDPYGNEDPNNLPEKWRPPLPSLLDEKDQETSCPCPQQYSGLIESCCLEWPPDRPTFEMVKKTLYKINPTKLSPVDLMMDMMQNYSKNLEVLVAERTQDLMAEKQKTDRLLYNMLPKVVADNLRIGKPVNAENYDSCSIYFSDIVSFTTLSSNCDPMDVVSLLNKLYTTFDSIIEEYDVYKVETIGDAYMVVSGVPKIIPYHAKEVADMAIDIVQACREFVIPHRPEEPLQIRVGIHSGPVCAGVVGQKMPRYCLFGDTVNTASRMESNSEPYKIHVSDSAYRQLVACGGHVCTLRGVIPIKGKGDMKTWWVTGRTETRSRQTSNLSSATQEKTQQNSVILNRDAYSSTNELTSVDC
ncbi:atrial natriuretic peptide receptor 1-like [Gigantopelta aegis]|uniref:atrial natriuretic peptide receptor 1-like n=1 Tax=Gigantopelta aegis TaxID=1735272 RepID=UPI001B888D6E|nr:atrial natriuretic peptide receptor 1-like [Gigantopelta aegis]